jgi:Mrp family chromosome partitioning ATPase
MLRLLAERAASEPAEPAPPPRVARKVIIRHISHAPVPSPLGMARAEPVAPIELPPSSGPVPGLPRSGPLSGLTFIPLGAIAAASGPSARLDLPPEIVLPPLPEAETAPPPAAPPATAPLNELVAPAAELAIWWPVEGGASPPSVVVAEAWEPGCAAASSLVTTDFQAIDFGPLAAERQAVECWRGDGLSLATGSAALPPAPQAPAHQRQIRLDAAHGASSQRPHLRFAPANEPGDEHAATPELGSGESAAVAEATDRPLAAEPVPLEPVASTGPWDAPSPDEYADEDQETDAAPEAHQSAAPIAAELATSLAGEQAPAGESLELAPIAPFEIDPHQWQQEVELIRAAHATAGGSELEHELTLAPGSEDAAPAAAAVGPAAPEAPARAVPLWEVDRFQWPRTCEKLLSDENGYFAQAGEKLLAAVQDGLRVLAITGSRRGEGRTTIALCLARAAAAAGVQVAVMDGDFARPQLASKVGLEIAHGWQDAALGNIPLSEAAVKSLADNITILPLEPSVTTRGLSLADPRVTATLRAAAATFDLLIVDLGPLGPGETLQFPEGESCPLEAAIVVHDTRFGTSAQSQALGVQLQEAGIEAVGIAENFLTEEELLQRPTA